MGHGPIHIQINSDVVGLYRGLSGSRTDCRDTSLQAVLDIADNSRLVLELTIKHHNAKIDGTVPQITKLRSEPKLKRDATPKGAG